MAASTHSSLRSAVAASPGSASSARLMVKGRNRAGGHSGTPGAGAPRLAPAALYLAHERLAEASNATAATYATLGSAAEATMPHERSAKLPGRPASYEVPMLHQAAASSDPGPFQFCTVLDSMDMDAPSDSEEHALTRGYEAGAWLRG